MKIVLISNDKNWRILAYFIGGWRSDRYKPTHLTGSKICQFYMDFQGHEGRVRDGIKVPKVADCELTSVVTRPTIILLISQVESYNFLKLSGMY